MKIRVGATTDVGRVRDGNEDAYIAEDPLFAVADGMGGHLGGEVASALALETLGVLFKHRRGSLADQVREANRAVFERSSRDAAVAGMGTTLTAAVADAGQIRLAHVGDSRAYLFRGGELRMLTADHTLVRRMVERGEITDEEAGVHPQRSVLIRAIGAESDVVVDEGLVDVQGGDRLLLCSDGLTGMLEDEEIRSLLAQQRDPQRAADDMVRRANAAGGVDNITVVILDVEVDEDETSRGPDTSTRPNAIEDEGTTIGRARRSVPWLRIAAWLAGIAVLVMVALVATRAYLDRQWYVSVAGDKVAVYQGVPSEVLGFQLHHAVLVTDLDAAAVARLPFYSELRRGITADSREQADAVVEQMRADLSSRSGGSGGSAAGGSSGGSGTAAMEAA